MRAIKYSRYTQSWHWSQSVGEDLIYFPEAKAIAYSGSAAGKTYKGITHDMRFIEEAEQYISSVEKGDIQKYINDEHKEINEKGLDANKQYSSDALILKDKIYVQIIPEQKTETSTIAPITLSGYEEVEVDMTVEDIKEIFKKQTDFTMKKAAFEVEQKRFEESITNINNHIVKKEKE